MSSKSASMLQPPPLHKRYCNDVGVHCDAADCSLLYIPCITIIILPETAVSTAFDDGKYGKIRFTYGIVVAFGASGGLLPEAERKKNFVKEKLADRIVRLRMLILPLMLLAAIAAGTCIGRTNINYDLGRYLAKDTMTRRALAVMTGESAQHSSCGSCLWIRRIPRCGRS